VSFIVIKESHPKFSKKKPVQKVSNIQGVSLILFILRCKILGQKVLKNEVPVCFLNPKFKEIL